MINQSIMRRYTIINLEALQPPQIKFNYKGVLCQRRKEGSYLTKMSGFIDTLRTFSMMKEARFWKNLSILSCQI